MSKPYISSLLDTDLYKFTMMQCIIHQLPDVQVGYRLILRKPINLKRCYPLIKEQISNLCQLRFQKPELDYLKSLGFFKKDFLHYLSSFQLPEKTIQLLDKDDNLTLTIEGNWKDVILFEVPLLAIISEAYYHTHYPKPQYEEGRKRLNTKIDYLLPFTPNIAITEFGTRRRFSYDWQEEVIATLQRRLGASLVGTSNVLFAKEFNLKPIGTMAHEFFQACQVLAPNIKGSQHFALQTWLKEYPHQLGIALTDSLTMDVFLQEFDANLAKHYEGLRQDSGDPIEWGEKALRHYQQLNINAKNKTFVFSDNLNVEKTVKIYNHFKEKCHPLFGIGTNLSNDLGYDPIDVVIKMIHTNKHPVIKITDSKGKTVCDDENYLQKIKTIFNLKD